jgi:RHS repeat-associated protein
MSQISKSVIGVLVFLLAWDAGAIVATTSYEQVTWSIDKIADSYVSLIQHTLNNYRYRADLQPGMSYKFTVSVTTNSDPANHCAWYNRSLLARIPIGAEYSTAGVVDGGNSSPISFSHSDVYWPEPGNENVSIEYDFNANWCEPGGLPGHHSYAWISVEPLRKDEISFYPPRRGDPDPRKTDEDPPKRKQRRDRFKPPEGCNRCSTMGLPGFRVNMATLNLLVQDTEFQYSGVGPSIAMTRTYNADPTLSGMFGAGWTFSYEWFALAYQQGVYVQSGDGSGWNFRVPTNAILPDGSYSPSWDGTYLSSTGHFDRLRMTTVGGKALFTLWNKATRQWFGFQSAVSPTQFMDESYSVQVPLDWISDENSNTVTILHTNTSGYVTAVIDAAGRVTTFSYGPNGLCSHMTTPDGRSTTYTYTGNLLTQTLDLAGKLTTYAYTTDTNHFLTTQNTEGKIWQVTYAGTPWHVASVVDAAGYTNYYDLLQPSMSNRIVQKRNARGETAVYESRNGLTTAINGPGANLQSTVFNNGLPYHVSDSLGRTRTTEYDARGNLIRLTREDSTVESFVYDAQDRLLFMTNSQGYGSVLQYDACGNLTCYTQPDGRQITWSFDSRGLMTSMTVPGSGTWAFGHDVFGNLTFMADPLGNTNRLAYSPYGLRLVAITNSLGRSLIPTFDDNQRLTRLTNPDGTYREYFYDCCAQTTVRNERGLTNRVVRDPFLNISQFTDAMGFTTYYTYDANRNLVRVQYPDGSFTSLGYDSLDLPVAITNSSGSMLRMAHDANGRMTDLWTARDGHYVFDWDPLGRLVGITYPNHVGSYLERLSFTLFNRNPEGLITNITDSFNWAINHSINLIRDRNQRIVEKQYNGVSVATYAYGTSSLPVSVQDASGLTTFERDARGLVTNLIYPDGLSVQFSYDAEGDLAALAYPGGPTVTYNRDARQRVTNMLWSAQGIRFLRDAVGNVTNEIRSNGTESQYTFNAVDRLTGLLHKTGTNVMIQLRYERDSMGRTTNTVKLAGVLSSTPVFGPSTNRGGYDLSDEITNWNGNVCQTDWRGNLTNAPGLMGYRATYDAENRLLSCTRNGTNWQFTYNGLGQRIRRVQNGVTNSFYYDHQGRLLFVSDDAGVITARYFYRGRVLVAMWAAGKGHHFYHFDKVGSTLALTDEQGRYSAIYRYLPHGAVASVYSKVENPFTWVGRYGVLDEGAGLFLMQNRHYDAILGRFLQRDPIGLNGGVNIFAYALNNPTENIDPSGFGVFGDLLSYAVRKSDAAYCVVKTAHDAARDTAVQVDLALSKYEAADYDSLPPNTQAQLEFLSMADSFLKQAADDANPILYGPYDWRLGSSEAEAYGPGSRDIVRQPFDESNLASEGESSD